MASADPLIGTRMRVWWPPTTNKEKTGYAGAYWPVKVLGKRKHKYTVEYDNGEQEDVLTEHLAPDDPPVDFGSEKVVLQPGEFCEVSNGSRTDPCAWVALVAKRMQNGSYWVQYPFHDAEPEAIEAHRIRRARVLDMEGWCLLKPNQRWRDGDIQSPHELETIKEDELKTFYPNLFKGLKGPHTTRNGAESSSSGRVGDKRAGESIKQQSTRQRIKLD